TSYACCRRIGNGSVLALSSPRSHGARRMAEDRSWNRRALPYGGHYSQRVPTSRRCGRTMGTSADQSGRTVRATQMGRLCGGSRPIARVCQRSGGGKPVISKLSPLTKLAGILGGPLGGAARFEFVGVQC